MSPAGAKPRDILIGVDGGATKTLVRIEDGDGRPLGRGRGGPANIQHSVEESWRSILDAVGQAMTEAGLAFDAGGHRLLCGAGLAGTEVTTARDRFLAVPHPFARLVVKSDGYVSCLGAHDGRDGMVIAIGTGTIAFQIEGDREERAGGWGFPHGDEGGGAWLGLEAVRLAFHALDGRIPSSPLADAVFARFDRDLDRLVGFATQANATRFAQLAPVVIEEAGRGTPLALELLARAAGEVDRLAAALAGRASRPDLPCALLGGLAPFVEPRLGPALRSRLVRAERDAVYGALLLIRRAVAAEEAALQPGGR
jgi:glucosamine kinase